MPWPRGAVSASGRWRNRCKWQVTCCKGYAAWLQELVLHKICKLFHVPGNANPADAFTKHVPPKGLWQEYMARMYNCEVANIAKASA